MTRSSAESFSISEAIVMATKSEITPTAKAVKAKFLCTHNPAGHPSYAAMVQEAVMTLKERMGSSLVAIKKFIGDKYKSKLASNWEKLTRFHAKRMSEQGTLSRVKAFFKLTAAAKISAKVKKATIEPAVKKATLKEPAVKEPAAKTDEAKTTPENTADEPKASANPEAAAQPKVLAEDMLGSATAAADATASSAHAATPKALLTDVDNKLVNFKYPKPSWAFDTWRPCLIRPGLYLSHMDLEADWQSLVYHKITHVLQVGRELEPSFPDRLVYEKVSIRDEGYEDLVRHFERCFKFIDEGRQKGQVLVHCWAGVSRSATVVIAYLMWQEKTTYLDAREAVRAARPCIQPNNGFILQLQAFERVNCQLNVLPPYVSANWYGRRYGPARLTQPDACEVTTSGTAEDSKAMPE